jgi:hypothetical protein
VLVPGLPAYDVVPLGLGTVVADYLLFDAGDEVGELLWELAHLALDAH